MMSLMAILCSTLIVSGGCQQLIVAASDTPSPDWAITDYTFQYTEGNSTYKICGQAAYGITRSKLGMWLELNVTNVPVTLVIYAKLNHTDAHGIVKQYYLSHTQYYDVGNSPVHLESEDNYKVGTYDVIEVEARIT